MREKLLIYIGLFSWTISVLSAGRGEWNALGSYQYYVSGKGDLKSNDDGKLFCKNNDGEMAMIKTSEIQTFIQNQVSATSGTPYGFYIGLKEVGTNNTFIWNDNSELTYNNWNTGEPSSGEPEPCVAMGYWHTYFANLPWFDFECAANAPTGFVCQRLIGWNWGSWKSWGSCECPGIRQRNRTCVDSGRIGLYICNDTAKQSEICTPSASCNATMPSLTTAPIPPDRGNWFPNGSYEYYVSPGGSSRSYEVSKTFCKEREGELALIKNEMTQGFMKTLVSDGSGEPYTFYIGLVYDKSESMFQWNDGTNLSFTRWDDGQPNPHISGTQICVSIGKQKIYDANLLWHTRDCETGATGSKGLVCQRRIGRNWGSWESWGSCECPGIRQRNRTCVDSSRIGPNSCNDTATQSKICTPSVSCNVTMPSLTTAPTTLNRGNWFPNGNYEYYVSPGGSTRSYKDSKTFCKNKESELALIKDDITQGFLKTLIFDGSGEPYTFYIGLVYDKSKSMFQWNDGTNLSFIRWDEGEPNNHDTDSGTQTCVSIGEQKTYDANLLWHTMDCDTGATGLKGLMCQRIIGKYWETWSSWSLCNCSSMMKIRNRTCIDSSRMGPNNCIGSNFETTKCSKDTTCETTPTPSTVEMTTTNKYHELTTPTDMTHTSALSAIANDTKTTEINILSPISAITTTTTNSSEHNILLVAIISSIVTLILAAILFGIVLLIRRCRVMRRNSQKIATQPQSLSEMNNVVNDVPSSYEKFDEVQTSQLNSGNYEIREEKEGNYEIPHNYEEIKERDHQYEEMDDGETIEHPYINSMPENEYDA
ncbi:uncharacterized protein LOC144422995 [Styela clava]